MKTLPQLAIFCLAIVPAGAADYDTPPRVLDDRFELQLVLADPDIVTPIGAVVDAIGRLFVVESHTHDAPKNYAGPKRDRIKLLTDENGDGIPETQRVFEDDLKQAMNLAFAPDGTLFVVCAKEILALHDRDGDGRCEAKTRVLRLETPNSNPHGQLLALTHSHDGWIYTSRGNIGSADYRFIGAEGAEISGGGEGGEIVRLRTDGSGLQRVATGFWNPFDLRFDFKGRLLCVDNDPDSRGPNRLLHIVPGGDYGYRARYGGSGLHPYDAWEGDLPGTLPMIAGVGEAPSAVLDLSQTGFPDDYGQGILVTVWGEHNLTLYEPKQSGVSITATGKPFITGGQDFRPVALAPAPDGSVFITDWVLKDYPNHGRGRIWRLALKAGGQGRQPRSTLSKPEADEAFAVFEKLGSTEQDKLEDIKQGLHSGDSFLHTAALQSLASPGFHATARAWLTSEDTALRLGALLALRRAEVEDAATLLPALLRDTDVAVRQMALIWAGEHGLKELLPHLDDAVSAGEVTPRLFETWLATVQILRAGGKVERNSSIDASFIEQLARDETRPAMLRALALPRIKEPGKESNTQLLLKLAAADGDEPLRREAIRSLAALPSKQAAGVLLNIAIDTSQPARLRCEAVLALSNQPDTATALLPLLDDPASSVAVQTARTLRFAATMPDVRAAMERKLAAIGKTDDRLADALQFALGKTTELPPATVEEWVKRVGDGGDIEAGERVFFSSAATCVTCHCIQQRGGSIGPDLSVIARVANREQLIHSIVKPSDDVAPQFQGWMVSTKDGQSIIGLQGHGRSGGAVSIITFDGKTLNIPGSNVSSFQAMPASIMPEGLPLTMSPGAFRDLIAYLESLR